MHAVTLITSSWRVVEELGCDLADSVVQSVVCAGSTTYIDSEETCDRRGMGAVTT